MSRDWTKENPQNFIEYQEAMKFHKARAEQAESQNAHLIEVNGALKKEVQRIYSENVSLKMDIDRLIQHLCKIALPHTQQALNRSETLAYRNSLQYAIDTLTNKHPRKSQTGGGE